MWNPCVAAGLKHALGMHLVTMTRPCRLHVTYLFYQRCSAGHGKEVDGNLRHLLVELERALAVPPPPIRGSVMVSPHSEIESRVLSGWYSETYQIL